MPKRGEVIAHPDGIDFEVLDADPRRVKRLRVRSLPAASAGKEARRVPEATALPHPPGARMVTPLCRLAQDLAALSGWRRYGSPSRSASCCAGALPPVD